MKILPKLYLILSITELNNIYCSGQVVNICGFLKDKNIRPFAMGSASIAYGTPLHWSAQAGVHERLKSVLDRD